MLPNPALHRTIGFPAPLGRSLVGERQRRWADMKDTRRAEISVGEPWDFEGNDGPNRLVVDRVDVVPGPQVENWASRYLLLRVANPFEYQAERVEWLIASPRYEGVTLEMLADSGGTAGIARLRPGVRLDDGVPFKTDDVDYFMIGGISYV